MQYMSPVSAVHTRYDLAKVQVEQGKMLLAEDDLLKQEDKWKRERTGLAHHRNQNEQIYADQAVQRTKSHHK